MTRVLAAVLGGLMLGGCALPVPLQIASWALDGFSLLATQKSITDHGLSIVAQQDCALWRGVTEGQVCRETDPMAIMVAEGDVVTEGTTPETGSAMTSLQTMLTTKTVEPEQTAPDSWVVQADAVDVVENTAEEPVQVASVEPTAAVEDEAPSWQMVSEEPEMIAPVSDDLASYNATPGDYFVIGSFGVWDNAKRFALKHAPLDARIIAASVADYRVFRIVVGPYTADNQNTLRGNIRSAKIDDIWAVRVPADDLTLAWRSADTSTELAAVSQTE